MLATGLIIIPLDLIEVSLQNLDTKWLTANIDGSSSQVTTVLSYQTIEQSGPFGEGASHLGQICDSAYKDLQQ